VNGKTRGKVSLPKDVTQDAAFAAVRSDAALAKFITGAPKKVIFVPGRLINIVV
jgi:leucyl-tRNA synthetase